MRVNSPDSRLPLYAWRAENSRQLQGGGKGRETIWGAGHLAGVKATAPLRLLVFWVTRTDTTGEQHGSHAYETRHRICRHHLLAGNHCGRATAGDADCSQLADPLDLAAVEAAIFECRACADDDANCDGVVTAADLVRLVSLLGPPCRPRPPPTRCRRPRRPPRAHPPKLPREDHAHAYLHPDARPLPDRRRGSADRGRQSDGDRSHQRNPQRPSGECHLSQRQRPRGNVQRKQRRQPTVPHALGPGAVGAHAECRHPPPVSTSIRPRCCSPVPSRTACASQPLPASPSCAAPPTQSAATPCATHWRRRTPRPSRR